MTGSVEQIMQWLSGAPVVLILLTLGLAAALENIVPPIPADVVVLLGGVLAGQGIVNIGVAFVTVWLSNVGGALVVYVVGLRYGSAFFAGRWGQMILRPQQLQQLDDFYRRYGVRVIFVSRFLPMFRAVVPVFAGVSGVSFWRTALPMAATSGLWYGFVIYLGSAAGRNWQQILQVLGDAGRWLWLAAAVLIAAVAWWWWRSR